MMQPPKGRLTEHESRLLEKLEQERANGRSNLTSTALYFLTLGVSGFGGPVALAERMHQDLVNRKRWIGESRYREGLAFAQLSPGPLAAQLAMYIGWLRAGVPGAAVAGIAIVAPSFFLVLAAAVAYQQAGGLPWVAGALYGAGSAVIAIVARSGWRLAKTSLRRDRLLWSIAAANFALVAWGRTEHVLAIVASAAIVWAIRSGFSPTIPSTLSLGVVALPTTASSAIPSMFWFFLKSGAVVFGSGLAIVPFLYGGVVEQHHWLTDRQFLDAVAVGLLTPGPVVIMVSFIGYLVAGVGGAVVAAVGVFVPAFLLVAIAAPHVARITANRSARAAVDGAVAGAVGALLGAVVVLASRSLTDRLTWSIALLSLAVILATRRVPDLVVLGCAGMVGVLTWNPV